MLSECLQKFKESVGVGIIWSKEGNRIQIRFDNESDNSFYCIQGELLFFNANKRAIGGTLLVYKYLLPGGSLSDDFKDSSIEIPKNTQTVTFKISSVECEDPFLCTSVEERSMEVEDHNGDKKIAKKRVFDTDLFQSPED